MNSEPADYVSVPRKLTAENGAKAALMGEFKIIITDACPECYSNRSDDSESDTDCNTCDGYGEVYRDVIVHWPMIKQIYAAAIEHFTNDHETKTQAS